VTLYGPRDKAAIEQIERFTKNRFEWLQPPNPKTLVLTAGDTASLDAAAIPDAAAGLFHTAAEKLLQAKGGDAVAAVAAALALATDTTQVPTARSLLTSQDGYVTMQVRNEGGWGGGRCSGRAGGYEPGHRG
jgi:ATP-dependent RNA helicase DDX21